MAVGPSRCCGGVVTDCGQTSNKMTLNETTSRWKGSRGLSMALPIATSLTPQPLHHYATTDLLQPATFNTTTVLHPTRSSTTPPDIKIRQLYNNRQQHPVYYDTRVWLISPKSVGLVFIVSFYFIPYWLLRYDMSRRMFYCNQNYIPFLQR